MTAAAPRSPIRKAAGRWRDEDELRWAIRGWAGRIGVPTPTIHVRALKSKWASMSSAGRLTIDRGLLRLSRDLGEYVIVHELVHRLAPNHGRVFKAFMAAYLPDWEERDKRLRRRVGRPLKAEIVRESAEP